MRVPPGPGPRRPETEDPMPQRPHLLYLAWGFPPSRAGGVYRALATVNAFAAAGWRVTVVTAERSVFERHTGVDPSLEARVDPVVRVVRIPFDWPAQSADIRGYSLARVAVPPLWSRARRRLDRWAFPEASYGPWRAPLSEAARGVHAQDPVDLVVATANPHVTFAAAYDLHRSAGVPFVMDYRDAWRLDVFSGAELAGARSREGRWERRLIDAAHQVWFVNEPIRAWHATTYPEAADRMRVVANGWDPDLLDVAPPAPAGDGPLRFAYLGTVTPKVPVAELVAGWRLALADGRVPPGSTLTVAGHLGYFAVPQRGLAEALADGADAGVRFVGPVPKGEVSAFYAEADVLVLALGTGRYVTSGKVFEYVATGRPIVAVHGTDNASSDVLAEHPLTAMVTDVSPPAVADALARGAALARSVDEDGRAAVAELAVRYRRSEQLSPPIEDLTRELAR